MTTRAAPRQSSTLRIRHERMHSWGKNLSSNFSRDFDIRIKAIYVVALLALYFALAQVYVEVVQPQFAYRGFKQSYLLTAEAGSLVAVCIAALLLPSRFRRPSDLFIALAVVLTLVPTAVMHVFANLRWDTACATYAGIATIFFVRDIPINAPRFRLDHGLMILAILTATSILGVAITTYRMGFDNFSLDYVDVYRRRGIAFWTLTGSVGYFVAVALLGNVLAVVMSAVGRCWALLILNLLAAVMFFGFMGYKGAFVQALTFAIAYHFVKNRYTIPVVVSAFALTAVIYNYFFADAEHLLFLASFQVRMMLAPVLLNDTYILHFNDIGFLYWSYSKLSFIFGEKYALSEMPQTIIGYYLTGGFDEHANTGFIGSGYMNAGFVGIAIYAVLIGMFCRVIDSLAAQRQTEAFAALACLPGFLYAVTTADLPYVVLSGGWGLSMLAVAFADPRALQPRTMSQRREALLRR